MMKRVAVRSMNDTCGRHGGESVARERGHERSDAMTIESTDIETRSVDRELHDLDDEGMTATFSVIPGAKLRCSSCNEALDARDCQIVDVRRLEGSSDPAEMAAVIGLRCPHCHALGKL